MTPKTKKYLAHIKQKKDYWFGKDEGVYNFFNGQYVLYMDLIAKNMLREGE